MSSKFEYSISDSLLAQISLTPLPTSASHHGNHSNSENFNTTQISFDDCVCSTPKLQRTTAFTGIKSRKRVGCSTVTAICEAQSTSKKRRSLPRSCKKSATVKARELVYDKFSATPIELNYSNSGADDEGDFFGLSSKVRKLFEVHRKIKQLYDWQIRCLTSETVKSRKNMIISLPTSAGKTLIAEILILQQLLLSNNDAILILPFVSIVQEKVEALQQFAAKLDFNLEEYAATKGRIPPIRRLKGRSLYVATIEKAHLLINSLIEYDRLKNVGLVVVDELHMIGEDSRGTCLEQMLTKLIFLSQKIDNQNLRVQLQIVGMSATLSNIDDLLKFLHADLFITDFRPVPLVEYAKIGTKLYNFDRFNGSDNCFTLNRDLLCDNESCDDKSSSSEDVDHLCCLVNEVAPPYSCLIFCPTKKSAENVAVLLAKQKSSKFADLIMNLNDDKNKKRSRAELTVVERRSQLLLALRSESDGHTICSCMGLCIPKGIAYHHSGLTADERKLIQDAYLEGILHTLCCTSTLAAGVNLPAKRVIIRSGTIGNQLLTRHQYTQMIGRAGRAGLDQSGESILILSNKIQSQKILRNLCTSSCTESESQKCLSCLLGYHSNNNGSSAATVCPLISLVLSCVGLKIVTNLATLRLLVMSTFCAQQLHQISMLNPNADTSKRFPSSMPLSVDDLIDFALQRLIDLKLIAKNDDDGSFNITFLGSAAYKAGFDVELVELIYNDLLKNLNCMTLSSYLHLLFCVVPVEHGIRADYNTFYTEYRKLAASDQKVFELLGMTELFLMKKCNGQSTAKYGVSEIKLSRLYVALIIFRLWQQQTPIGSVADHFHLTRGQLQQLLHLTATHASAVQRFCECVPELWALRKLLVDLPRELSYCVHPELLSLMELNGVKRARARQLYNAGYKSVSELANADWRQLVRQVANLSGRQARQIVAAATAKQFDDWQLFVDEHALTNRHMLKMIQQVVT